MTFSSFLHNVMSLEPVVTNRMSNHFCSYHFIIIEFHSSQYVTC